MRARIRKEENVEKNDKKVNESRRKRKGNEKREIWWNKGVKNERKNNEKDANYKIKARMKKIKKIRKEGEKLYNRGRTWKKEWGNKKWWNKECERRKRRKGDELLNSMKNK